MRDYHLCMDHHRSVDPSLQTLAIATLMRRDIAQMASRVPLALAVPEANFSKVDGRGHILVFRITPPETGVTIQIVNAYVPPVNRGQEEARSATLDLLTQVHAQAAHESALVLLQGDLNATTQGRRAGYGAHSRVWQVDKQLESILQSTGLVEVLPSERFSWARLTGTKKGTERQAALDHLSGVPPTWLQVPARNFGICQLHQRTTY
jgi:hypothetical protein